MREPIPLLPWSWSPFSLCLREPQRWRPVMVCAFAVLLLHGLMGYLLWRPASEPEVAPRAQVIAVRWQAQPQPLPKPELPSPPKPAAQPEVKPKPVPVLTKQEPHSREIKRVRPKPERKVPPRLARPAVQPARTVPSTREAAKPVPPAPTQPEPVVAPNYQAPGLNNPVLRYPPASKRLGEEGKVRLRVLVSARGEPQQIEILASSGHSRLDQAARELVSRWHFLPARQGANLVEGWVEVPIVFRLRSR